MTPPHTGVAVDVAPIACRMAMFHSAVIPHEVMPAFSNRHSITIWYYDAVERDEAVTRARVSGHAAQVAQSTPESQRDAKVFIGALMGGDEVGEDGGNPTEEDLRVLTERVRELSSPALSIVSSITGAPSEASFRQGFELLSLEDLKSMRQLFRRMGLNE